MTTNKHKFAEVFTPPELVSEILSKINFDKIKRIYEPGVGKGAFLEQINKINGTHQ
jgi:type I restriction-modification system DNA methylase subunit